MSYSSVYTTITSKNVISADVGAVIQKSSASSGGNLPATLVSGTQYTFCSTPFPFGNGTYIINVNFDLTGDNTTAFSYIKTVNYIGNIGGGVLSDKTLLVGTTFPDASTISIQYNIIYQLTSSTTNKSLSIAFTPTFGGTAPTISSAFLRFYKLN
jgi:hypothetical protein